MQKADLFCDKDFVCDYLIPGEVWVWILSCSVEKLICTVTKSFFHVIIVPGKVWCIYYCSVKKLFCSVTKVLCVCDYLIPGEVWVWILSCSVEKLFCTVTKRFFMWLIIPGQVWWHSAVLWKADLFCDKGFVCVWLADHWRSLGVNIKLFCEKSWPALWPFFYAIGQFLTLSWWVYRDCDKVLK